MKKIFLFLLCGLVVIGMNGCARLAAQWRGELDTYLYNGKNKVDNVYWSNATYDNAHWKNGFFWNEYIIQNKNDLYYRKTKENPEKHLYEFEDTPLTNTPDIAETSVRVYEKAGFITYFSNDPQGGKWYMQPMEGDYNNRKEVSPSDMIRLTQ